MTMYGNAGSGSTRHSALVMAAFKSRKAVCYAGPHENATVYDRISVIRAAMRAKCRTYWE